MNSNASTTSSLAHPTPPSQTSTPSTSSLPPHLISKLFEQLHGVFGSLWLDFVAGAKTEAMHRTWGAMLAGCSPAQLAAGLRGCEGLKFPPSAAYFAALCRPRIDPQEAFASVSDGTFRTHRVLYHAVQACGGSKMLLSAPYTSIAERWAAAIRRAEDDDRAGLLPDIPDVPDRPALPPPPRTPHEATVAQRAEAVALLAGVDRGRIPPARRWAYDVVCKVRDGEHVLPCPFLMAKSVVNLYGGHA